MSKLSSILILYEFILLVFFLMLAYSARKRPFLLIIVGISMIAATTLMLATLGIEEMMVAFLKGELAGAKIKAELLLPTLFVSFSTGAIGANLIATAITAKE